MKNIAFITGASSGLGRCFAKHLAWKASQSRDIDEFWLVGRNEQELKNCAKEIYAAFEGDTSCTVSKNSEDAYRALGPRDDNSDISAKSNKTPGLSIQIFPLDLTKETALTSLADALEASSPRIRWLINAAGYGKFGPFAQNAKRDITGMIDLNCRALTALTFVCLSYCSKGSHLINIASAAALLPQADLAVYAATKSYVRSFSNALAAELKPLGITVSAVCPRFMKTHFLEHPGNTKATKEFTWVGFEDVDTCVARTLKKAQRGRWTIFTSLPVALFNMVCKLFPARLLTQAEHTLGQHIARKQ